MRHHILLVTALLTGSLAAQGSSTIPKGYDTVEGAASQFWGGFDLGASSTATYNPAKSLFIYDASVFPWATSVGTVITKLSFRRDGASNTATAHSRTWVVIMSTNSTTGFKAAQANFNHYNNNHGSNRKVVFGSIATPKAVSFKATPAPKSPATAPFDVSITLNTPFVVPKNAKTLILEIRSYDVTGATKGWWRSDSVTYSGTGYSGGSFALINSDHCVSPSIFYTSRVEILGSNWTHIWRRGTTGPASQIVLSAVGIKLTTPIAWPGSPTCMLRVNPHAVKSFVSGPSGQHAVIEDWGKIPRSSALVGGKWDHQSLFIEPATAGGVAFTRAGTSGPIGTGYNPSLVAASQTYSYGANNTRYFPRVDPDKETHPRYFFRRAIIVKIN